jgi:DNA-binding LacI/PurR family transcriptional regulator
VTDDPGSGACSRRTLRRGRVDGVIVLSVALTDDEVAALGALDLPVVGLGVPRGELGGLRVDDTAVGRAATEHLLGLGHRDIAHIGQSVAGEARRPGLRHPHAAAPGSRQAMADAGPARFVAADFTVEGRRAALALSAPTPPTAIFAASDEMAYGVLTAAREIDCACRRTCP